LQTRRRLPVVGFDQFQECAVRILEAEELGSGLIAEADYHRLGNEVNARRLQPLIFLVEILGEPRDATDPGMVQMRVGLARGSRLLPCFAGTDGPFPLLAICHPRSGKGR
jgi:hypothetical protein